MRKSIAAATMAASLTLGGAAGVALFTPTISSAQTDETAPADDATDDATRPEPGQRIREALAPLVEDGTITQAQADAVADTLAESAGERRQHHRRSHARHQSIQSAAEVLGLDVADLRSQLAEGATLGDIAEAQGVSDQDVIDAIVAPIAERLDQAVANGDLTQEEADEKLAEATAKATELLDKVFEGRGPRGPGGDDADETTES